jgi:predicted MFS family arabinose efflux permease
VTSAAIDADVTLDGHQRRILLGVCVIVGAATVVPATYNYILTPMLADLGASESQQSVVRQLPSIAALLVIFLAGVLGSRWGERRLITAGATVFTVGCGVVAIAPSFPVAVTGLILESIGASALVVVALGLLSASVAAPGARASAFATFAIIGPVVYVSAPIVAGALVDSATWRLVVALWTLAGVAMLVAARRTLPHSPGADGHGELLTPALAGLALAAGVQTINAISSDGWTSSSTVFRLGATVCSAAALVAAFRRIQHPSLSLAALRSGGVLVLLVAVILIPFANLWFYLTMGYQYVYGFDALETALAMVPAQLAGVLGAMVARRMLQRRGITVTGVTCISLVAASLLLCLFITVDTPVAVAIAVMSCYAAASTAAGIPVTNAVMNSAPPGEDGSAAAFKGAASNVGGAVGVAVMTAIVFGAASTTLRTELAAEGLDDQQSAEIAAAMRDGASSESVASQYAVPLAEVDEISDAQQAAMIDGLHAQGVAAAVTTAAAAVMFLLGRRRQERSPPT